VVTSQVLHYEAAKVETGNIHVEDDNLIALVILVTQPNYCIDLRIPEIHTLVQVFSRKLHRNNPQLGGKSFIDFRCTFQEGEMWGMRGRRLNGISDFGF
jgi:hypothetical protein